MPSSQYVGELSQVPTNRKPTFKFIVDAKPYGAALYQSVTLVDATDYTHRRSSIFRNSARCDGLIKRDKCLNLNDLVARDGVEPPTPAFRAALFRPNRVFNQQLNSSEWPNYCDHSVTSADVRLRVGVEMFGVRRNERW